MNLTDYKEMIWGLFPQGKAWTREKNNALEDFISAISEECVRIDGKSVALHSEADPRTALELLGDWEKDFGLPDECTPLAGTTRGRRAAVMAVRNQERALHKQVFINSATAIGEDIEIYEWQPFVCGISECGSPHMIGGEEIRFTCTITVYGYPVHWFEAGISVCGDSLGAWTDAAELICRINKIKPAHIKIFFDYEEER